MQIQHKLSALSKQVVQNRIFKWILVPLLVEPYLSTRLESKSQFELLRVVNLFCQICLFQTELIPVSELEV